MDILEVFIRFGFALGMISVVMGLASYSVLAERKVSSWIHGRVGPNRTTLPIIGDIPIIGSFITRLGLFQPMADGLKFLFKEEIFPTHVNKVYYYLAPIITLVPAMTTMVVIPFGQIMDPDTGVSSALILSNIDVGLLFVFAISSLGVYGIVLAGWSSNSKYPFLGAVRSSAQMISYELAMGLSILPVLLWANPAGTDSVLGGLSLTNVVYSQEGWWLIFMQPVSAFVFLIALFAETNRTPFDMPESETDLVGGFHTEYGCFKFGMFFLSEYTHIIIGSAIFTILFLGGWHFLPFVANPWPVGIAGAVISVIWFLVKVLSLVFFFIWVRWTVPRFRYDQVMRLGWNGLLPIAIANLIFYVFFFALKDGVLN